MNNLLVSVIMPAFNSERHIKQSIESVINQEYSNWELIIVDDASQDNTVNIIENFIKQDSRIKLYKCKNNKGVVSARNLAIEQSSGRYIAFLDSDDFWNEKKLKLQIEFMISNNLAFSFTDYMLVNEDGNFIKNIKCPEEIDYMKALKGNRIGCLTVVIDKSKVNDVSVVDLKHEDYATWLKIFRSGINAKGLNLNLANYRKTNQSLSSNKLKTIKWTWDIYRKNEKLSILKSCYYLSFHLNNAILKHYKREKKDD